MSRLLVISLTVTVFVGVIFASAAAHCEESKPRRFAFIYAGTITNLSPGSTARIWLPVPQSTPHQRVKRTRTEVDGKIRMTREPRHGNAMLYFEARSDALGRIPISIEYDIERLPVRQGKGEPTAQTNAAYLKANSKVPVTDVVRRVFEERPTGKGRQLARKIYDQVDHHMRYAKPPNSGWGQGDTVWACDEGFGNCTDFHSLYISLCREMKLPARFEIGFPVPVGSEGEIGGYHCWATTALEGRWFPVDISEADKHPKQRNYFFGGLDANRVRFTLGRDIRLVPSNDTGPLNFFVYPHVEVDGKRHTSFEKGFRWREKTNRKDR